MFACRISRSIRTREWARTLCVIALTASSAAAQTIITIRDDVERNDYEAQKRSNTGVFIASENFAVARVGHQSSFNNSGTFAPGGITTMFFFKLPELPQGASITAAAFSVGVVAETSTGGQPTFNGDLYSLGVLDTIAKDATEAQNFWYIGNTAQAALPTPLPGGVERVVDDFLTPADWIASGGGQSALPKTANITTYIQNLYAGAPGNGFTPGTSYLAIRINPDADTPPGGTQRYSLAFEGTEANGGAGSEGNRPQITLTLDGQSGCVEVPPVQVSPAPAGATSVYVAEVDPDAGLIKVYANDVEVGSAAGTPGSTPSVVTVTTTPLVDGETLIARQTIDGIESCVAAPTRTVGSCFSVPVVSIPAILNAGDTSVTVSGVSPLAGEVKIYANDTPIGSAAGSPPTTSATLVVSVAALVAPDEIKARQVINGVERCLSGGASIVVGVPDVVLVTDGFGDGDRDNDGQRDDPDSSGIGVVDDANDVGAKWSKLTEFTHDVKVAHDVAAPGLGDDNVYNIHITDQDGIAIASFPTVTLSQPGDMIQVSMKIKFNQWATNGERDNFRFGLFNHSGAPVSGDLIDLAGVVDDPSYFGTINSGPQTSVRRIGRGASATGGGALFDLAETLESVSQPGIGDNNAHDVRFTVVRTADDTILLELQLDGQIVTSAEDTTSGGGGPYFTFNHVAFGGVAVAAANIPYLDVSVDDVLVASSVNPCNNPVFDTNGDTFVDMVDFQVFKNCALGPNVPLDPDAGECECMDRDEDGDLDMDDFARFQLCFSGTEAANAACDD